MEQKSKYETLSTYKVGIELSKVKNTETGATYFNYRLPIIVDDEVHYIELQPKNYNSLENKLLDKHLQKQSNLKK